MNKTKRFINRTGLIGYMEEDVVRIITVADYVVELIFNLKIVIPVEDIISSEIPA
jgi:hypothetical protein